MLIRGKEYVVVTDNGNTVKDVDLDNIVTDYYDNFDYIVGDWAYGKVRLKGFYDNESKLVRSHNNIKNLDNYLNNNCAYGCKYFVLKKKEEIIEK